MNRRIDRQARREAGQQWKGRERERGTEREKPRDTSARLLLRHVKHFMNGSFSVPEVDEGWGAYSSVPCLSRLTIDRVSLSRQRAVFKRGERGGGS